MPNDCLNTLHIKGNKKRLERIHEDITSVDDEGKRILDFNRIIPPPGDNLCDYEWNAENWGTKWNALEPMEIKVKGRDLVISFQTAWTPPLKVYDELIRRYEGSDEFRDVEIEYYYYEPQGGFTGNRYEEYDPYDENNPADLNVYAAKVQENGFALEMMWTGIIYDEEIQQYRFMTDSEQKYFDENLTLEGFQAAGQ